MSKVNQIYGFLFDSILFIVENNKKRNYGFLHNYLNLSFETEYNLNLSSIKDDKKS